MLDKLMGSFSASYLFSRNVSLNLYSNEIHSPNFITVVFQTLCDSAVAPVACRLLRVKTRYFYHSGCSVVLDIYIFSKHSIGTTNTNFNFIWAYDTDSPQFGNFEFFLFTRINYARVQWTRNKISWDTKLSHLHKKFLNFHSHSCASIFKRLLHKDT